MIKFFLKNVSKHKSPFVFYKMKQGYSLLELLLYVSIFSVISLVVINAMMTMTKAFKETAVQSEFTQSSQMMERISREIRKAYNINTISSNNLKLDTTDDMGVNKTVKFALTGTDIEFFENDIKVGNLNLPDIAVLDLVFTNLVVEEGQAVRIFLTFKSNNDLNGRSIDFYDTVVLRGSY